MEIRNWESKSRNEFEDSESKSRVENRNKLDIGNRVLKTKNEIKKRYWIREAIIEIFKRNLNLESQSIIIIENHNFKSIVGRAELKSKIQIELRNKKRESKSSGALKTKIEFKKLIWNRKYRTEI